VKPLKEKTKYYKNATWFAESIINFEANLCELRPQYVYNYIIV